MSANQLQQILQKNYDELVINGKSGCYFLNVNQENKFRFAIEKFCQANDLHDVIKIQMQPSNLTDPLTLIIKLIKDIAQVYYKNDYQQFFIKYKEDHPETTNIVDLFLDEKTQLLDFPLPDEIRYYQTLYVKTFIRIFYELTKGTNPPIIFISGFQYASHSFLAFFANFIRKDHQDHNFLVFSSFCANQRPNLKSDNSLWTKWIWDLECNGRLIHYDIDDLEDEEVCWSCTQINQDLGTNVIFTLNKAEELISQVCFIEALQLLQQIYDLVNESYESSIRIRINLLMGRAQLFNGSYEEALVSFDRLNDLAQKLNDQKSLCLSNLELAYTHVFRGDYKAAQRYVTYALKYAQEVGGNLAIQAQFCEFVVVDLAAEPFPLDHMQKLLADLQLNDLYREHIYVLSKIFSQEPFHPIEFNIDVCLIHVNEAISLAQEHHLDLLLAGAYHGKGIIYVKIGQIDKAITCFRESETIRNGLDVPSELARIKNGIGYLYCLKEDYRNSHLYYINAMRTVIHLNDLAEISSTLFNLAWLYFQIGESQGALSVLNTLWEILKLNNTKYFPFRNIHDVFLLQGFVHFSQGLYVHSSQMVENSLNLDIDVSSQGSLLRPLLQALLATVYREEEKAELYLNEAETAWKATEGQLSFLHDLLYMRCRIYILRHWNKYELAYAELKRATKFCKEHDYKLGLDLINRIWTMQSIPQYFINDPDFKVPSVELKQILFIIKQERSVKNLWQQVYGMRLCSLLQQLSSASDDLDYISSETLRLLCMHYNVQGGLVYKLDHEHKHKNKDQSERKVKVLATYSQLRKFLFDYSKFEKFIIEHENDVNIVHKNVRIDASEVFSSIILLPLLESKKLIGHILLTTDIGDFDVDDNQIDTLKFIANILASKLINIDQRDQLIKLSTRDQLTGLRNRQYFQGRLAKVKHESNCCLAFIDLDNFKNYNDTFGHDVGDKLLIWFAEILTDIESKKIKVCRWGGDEFLILFNDMLLDEAKKIMYEMKAHLASKKGFVLELSQFLNKPIRLPEHLYLDFSAGVCAAENMEETIDPARLLQLADSRLYQVKRSGKAQILCCGYNDDLETEYSNT